MREILFRGKTIDNEDYFSDDEITSAWFYGYYYKDELDIDCIVSYDKIGKTWNIREIDANTLGQFITTEDGVRIFEGDIIEEVKHGRFIRRFVAEDIRTFTRMYDQAGHNSIWKVIGNIHDNPELLEVTK